MASSRLRVFRGPETTVTQNENQVTVPLSEILPLLADALQSRRTWLSDFSDDPVTISSDLYEVVLAYQHLRRPRPSA